MKIDYSRYDKFCLPNIRYDYNDVKEFFTAFIDIGLSKTQNVTVMCLVCGLAKEFYFGKTGLVKIRHKCEVDTERYGNMVLCIILEVDDLGSTKYYVSDKFHLIR